jgi:multicomponent Na+:H+ antiporter subunit G
VNGALDVLIAALLVTGVALNLTAAIGLHRFPDVFCRMHAATKPATLGLLCVLAGAMLAIGELSAATKLALVAVLQLATNPVGGHMVGRAAWGSDVPMHPGTRLEPGVERPAPTA